MIPTNGFNSKQSEVNTGLQSFQVNVLKLLWDGTNQTLNPSDEMRRAPYIIYDWERDIERVIVFWEVSKWKQLDVRFNIWNG